MSLEYFEGPAGSGKTYSLVEALKIVLNAHPLADHEAVLGLTYMHGSRRRMHGSLARVAALRGRYHACTVDSLARALLCRWRTMARAIDPQFDLGTAPDFEKICQIGALLLGKPVVSRWLAARYPVVLVDELQDCRGDHLEIIKALESSCHVIAAADGFQDLNSTGINEAVEWLHGSSGTKNLLTGNRRTKQPVLLKAADRLRAAQDCGEILKSSLTSARNSNPAAGCAARTLHFKGLKDVAILTPTGPDKSPFVRDVVARLILKPIEPKGVNKPEGPFRVAWESSGEEEKAALLGKLGDLTVGVSLMRLRKLCANDTGATRDLYEWAEKRFRLKGEVDFAEAGISAAVDRILQSRRAFLPAASGMTIRAMTINQAKNREFEGVILLWPFSVGGGGGLESLRRRLYNALTRAKTWAVVIVQDDPTGPSRLTKPPFSKPVKPGQSQ